MLFSQAKVDASYVRRSSRVRWLFANLFFSNGKKGRRKDAAASILFGKRSKSLFTFAKSEKITNI